MTATNGSDSISAHAAQEFTEHGVEDKGSDPSANKSSELEMDGGAPSTPSDISKSASESRFPLANPTPASLTTAPQEDTALDTDQAVPDSVPVNPQHPPKNNPFGSTGEPEPKVDIHTDKNPNNLNPKDDNK